MIYISNEQLVTELKKLLLDSKSSQRDIAKKMGITPQALQNLLNKKQLSFSDMKRVLDCVNCDLLFDFSVRTSPVASSAETTQNDHAPNNSQSPISNPSKVGLQEHSSVSKPPKMPYRRFTPEEAAKIDANRLLTDNRYQVQIASDFGMEVLNMLVQQKRSETA